MGEPPRKYRSVYAVIAWWAWVAFALANWIDLAVQGRDRSSLLAALVLLLVTGLMYAGALRPRIMAGSGGLTVSNPLRDHQIGWPAVVAAEAAELVRIRCEWPLASPDGLPGTAAPGTAAPGAGTGRRVIVAWAVHSSRRGQAAARAREHRAREPRRRGGLGVFSLPGGSYPPPGAPGLRSARTGGGQAAGPRKPMSAEQVAAAITERAQAEHAQAGLAAVPPVTRWHWPSAAAIAVPAAALLIAALA